MDENDAFLFIKVQGLRTRLASVHEGLYYLASHGNAQELIRSAINHAIYQCSTSMANNRKDKIWLIHNRLGHPSFQTLKCMFPNECKSFCIKDFVCDVCEKAKQKRSSYSFQNIERRKYPFQLIHSDVWGPTLAPDILGFGWFLLFVDDFSKFTWIHLLRHKSKVAMKFNQFNQMIEQ